VPEGLLDYDRQTRRLSLTGGSRNDTAADEALPAQLAFLAAKPGQSGRQIELALTDYRREIVRKAIRRAVQTGQVETAPGSRNATLHHLSDLSAPSSPGVRQRGLSECASAPIGGALHSHSDEGSAPRRTQLANPQLVDELDPTCPDCGHDLAGPPGDDCGCRDAHGLVA
jgi:hypothetical protein